MSRALHLPATFAKAGKSRPAGPESLAGGERKGTYGWLAVDAQGHGLADRLLVGGGSAGTRTRTILWLDAVQQMARRSSEEHVYVTSSVDSDAGLRGVLDSLSETTARSCHLYFVRPRRFCAVQCCAGTGLKRSF